MLLGLHDTVAHSNHVPDDTAYHPRELFKPLFAHILTILHHPQEKPLSGNNNTLITLSSFLLCCVNCLSAPGAPKTSKNTYQSDVYWTVHHCDN